jgi:hypothetical protein
MEILLSVQHQRIAVSLNGVRVDAHPFSTGVLVYEQFDASIHQQFPPTLLVSGGSPLTVCLTRRP